MILTQIASQMCHAPVTKALVAFGANLPSPYRTAEQSVHAAIMAFKDVTSSKLEISRFYSTPAVPPGSGPDFVNAAAAFAWDGTAQELLAESQKIESRFGRVRAERWAARVIDLDLIGLGDQILPNRATEAHWRGLSPAAARIKEPAELILPHPRLSERAFVLVPLMDIAPDWMHPVLGLSVAEMCAALPASERAAISPL